MPSFFEIRTGDWTVKALYASFALVVIGGIFSIVDVFRGTQYAPGDVILKCNAGQCNYGEEKEHSAFKEMTKALDEEYFNKVAAEDPDLAERLKKSREYQTAFGGPDMALAQLMPTWGYNDARWALTCPKCSERSVYRAMKCPECKEVFFRGDAGDQRFADRCPNPDCKYSRQEERRKEYEAERKKDKKPKKK